MQKYAFGSQENTNVRMVVGYWEMASSFVTAGVLNQELLFQSAANCCSLGEGSPLLPKACESYREIRTPGAILEKVGNAYIKFIGPEAYTGFQAMIARTTSSAVQS